MILKRQQRGFGVITAIIILVLMASLAGFLVRVSTIRQWGSALDFDRARAYQAAQAGIQWAGYQIIKSPASSCVSGAVGTPVVVDVALDGTAFPGVGLTVTCTSINAVPRVVDVQSVACIPRNSGTPACPVAVPNAAYVEQALWAKFEKP